MDKIGKEKLEVFSYMIIEEFLMKKDMHDTLQQFRNEWSSSKPSESESLLSWYETCIKLRIQEFDLNTEKINNSRLSVLESCLNELITTSAYRSRRSKEELIDKLIPKVDKSINDQHLKTTLHQNNNLPNISNRISLKKEQPLSKSAAMFSLAVKMGQKNKPLQKNNSKASINESDPPLIPSKLDAELYNIMHQKNKQRLSNQSWIPEHLRKRLIERNLSVTIENLNEMKVLNNASTRNDKLQSSSELEHHKLLEELGTIQKKPCGCCEVLFLPTCLTNKVTYKAIIDIRIKWSEKLSISTFFDHDIIGKLSRYDEVSICLFCSQFFIDQEEYRPTYELLASQEIKKKNELKQKQEEAYWDPLLMLEADRQSGGLQNLDDFPERISNSSTIFQALKTDDHFQLNKGTYRDSKYS